MSGPIEPGGPWRSADGVPSISAEEHVARILAVVKGLPAESVALADAVGRVTAEPLWSRRPVPGVPSAAMDGYAVRSGDSRVLEVVGDLAAEADEAIALPPAGALRIMTGAALPVGADAVVPFERAREADEPERTLVHLPSEIAPGEHVRRAGEELDGGVLALECGTVLTPAAVALAATAGHGTLLVRRRPRVAVIATGSELVDPAATPARGELPDSNSYLMAAAAEAAGAVVVSRDRVGDDAAALLGALEGATERADAIVLSGGVGSGTRDVVRAELAPRGIDFRPVRIQPGRPQGFGLWRERPLFALPGTPGAVLVTFELFVAPALRRMGGLTPERRPIEPARLAVGWSRRPGRLQVVPVTVRPSEDGGAPLVEPCLGPGPGGRSLRAHAAAEALALLGEDDPASAGEPVGIIRLR